MDVSFTRRGFLPDNDPVWEFSRFPELEPLNDLGAQLPALLEDPGFRDQMRRINIPRWPRDQVEPDTLSELRLYYVRVGFLASGYINQVSQERAHRLPANLAVPLVHACRLLRRPPILSYDGYALYNWRRLDPTRPIALGNIETIQNFVHLADERWFILVHVEIEAIAAQQLAAIRDAQRALQQQDGDRLDACLEQITSALERQIAVLSRIPEQMRPEVYFRAFRPYIRFFEDVTYEGVDSRAMSFRGETGAQSSVMPALVAFMKIPHQRSILTDHLIDMRRFMPATHRQLLVEIEQMASPRLLASPATFNAVLDAMATFREVHLGWAEQYIRRHVADPRGTGGTPYMSWLQQLVDETRMARIPIKHTTGTQS